MQDSAKKIDHTKLTYADKCEITTGLAMAAIFTSLTVLIAPGIEAHRKHMENPAAYDHDTGKWERSELKLRF